MYLYITKTTGFPGKRKGYILSRWNGWNMRDDESCEIFFFSTLSMKSKRLLSLNIEINNPSLCERCKDSFFKVF